MYVTFSVWNGVRVGLFPFSLLLIHFFKMQNGSKLNLVMSNLMRPCSCFCRMDSGKLYSACDFSCVRIGKKVKSDTKIFPPQYSNGSLTGSAWSFSLAGSDRHLKSLTDDL